MVTDGVDVVLVNTEGATYPRYRSMRIAAHLLPLIGVSEARLLCACKECHEPAIAALLRQCVSIASAAAESGLVTTKQPTRKSSCANFTSAAGW